MNVECCGSCFGWGGNWPWIQQKQPQTSASFLLCTFKSSLYRWNWDWLTTTAFRPGAVFLSATIMQAADYQKRVFWLVWLLILFLSAAIHSLVPVSRWTANLSSLLYYSNTIVCAVQYWSENAPEGMVPVLRSHRGRQFINDLWMENGKWGLVVFSESGGLFKNNLLKSTSSLFLSIVLCLSRSLFCSSFWSSQWSSTSPSPTMTIFIPAGLWLSASPWLCPPSSAYPFMPSTRLPGPQEPPLERYSDLSPVFEIQADRKFLHPQPSYLKVYFILNWCIG